MITTATKQDNGTKEPAVGSRVDSRVRRAGASTTTIVHVLRILSADIKSDDGVANAALLEAAERMEELVALLRRAAGPMSHGHWSTAFRAKVTRAVR